MHSNMRLPRVCLAVILIGGLGCSSANTQVTRVQAEKEKLIAAIGSQQKLVQELKAKNEELALRLNEAEIEIARGPAAAGLRKFASKDSAAAATSTAAQTGAPGKVENTKLAWKPYRPQVDQAKLTELAQKYPWLKYDAGTQSLQLAAPLAFTSGNSALTPESKLTLDELAKVLKESNGRDLRVLVTGQAAAAGTVAAKEGDKAPTAARHLGTTRALEVADYLDRRGIPSDRLGVASTAVARKSAADINNPGLTVHLLEADVPLVGWGGTESIRR